MSAETPVRVRLTYATGAVRYHDAVHVRLDGAEIVLDTVDGAALRIGTVELSEWSVRRRDEHELVEPGTGRGRSS